MIKNFLFFGKKETKLERIYARELHKKDLEIAQLTKKNELLLKTALRQSASANEWKEYAQKLEKHIKNLEEELKKYK